MTDETVDLKEEKAVAKTEQGNGLIDLAAMMSVADRKPRDINKAIEQAIEIVTMDEESAAECFYLLDRGGDKISGPSIRLAETMASVWCNLAISIDEARIIDGQIRIEGRIIDMQSGVLEQDFAVKGIIKRDGTLYSQSMIDQTMMALRSYLYRNLVFRMIPPPIVRKVYNAALVKADGGLGFTDRQARVVEYWESQGVSKERLLDHLDRVAVDQITSENLGYLTALRNKIKLGDTTIDVVFQVKPIKPKKKPARPKQMVDPSTGEAIEEESKPAKGDERSALIERMDCACELKGYSFDTVLEWLVEIEKDTTPETCSLDALLKVVEAVEGKS